MSAISVTWTSGLNMHHVLSVTRPPDFDDCTPQLIEYGADSGSYSAAEKLG